MSDIFVSYASEDQLKAESVAKTLEECGWSVWWDKSILPGEKFDQVIEETINAAKCVVVLWSKNSTKSEWVKEEANIGKQRQILVPAKIDSIELPFGFTMIQTADLTKWEAGKGRPEFLKLQSAISKIIGNPEEPGPGPEHPKAQNNKRLILGIGAVALILVLCVIGWFLFSRSTIKVSYDANKGIITPSGLVPVGYGDNLTFTITPKSDFYIEDVKVDGNSVGAENIFTLNDVTSDHTIEAIFARISQVIEAEIRNLFNNLPQSNELPNWREQEHNPDIMYECRARLTSSGFSVNHRDTDKFIITRRFNAVGHCDRSKHPQGVPECNCNGSISATAVIQVQNTGLLKINNASANISGCQCLEGRGLAHVENTVKLFNGQYIDLSALQAGN